MLATEHAVVPYEIGDLVIINAYQLHRVQPFEGQRDRISYHGASGMCLNG